MKNVDLKLLLLDVDGTLTDGGVYILEDGSQFKKFNAKDGLGIKELIKRGVQVGIISHSSSTQMIYSRAKMLGINSCYVGKEDKITILKKWMEEMNISPKQIAYIGDDINDFDIMKTVGIAVCPSDAEAPIKKIAHIVLKKKGGEGCVREFIDWYLHVNNKSETIESQNLN